MSDGPATDPPDDRGDEGLSARFEDLSGPDAREILSDGSGGTLVERTGDDGEATGDGGPRRVVAEESVDEVFERFEEESPEEVMAADDRPDPEPEEVVIEGDVDGLFGDLSAVQPDPAETVAEGDDVLAAVDADGPSDEDELAGRSPERVVDEEGVDDLLGRVRSDRSPDDLFDDQGGHKRVVADSSVDEVFQRYTEESPEEVMQADDPALESPTEAEMQSIGEDDELLGELPDPPEDARDTGGVGAFVSESGEELLEQTGEDTHRTVGDSDVNAVFDRYEEDTVEEVIDAVEKSPEDDEMVETEVDESVEALFGDLGEVDLETSPVPDREDEGPGPAPSPEETADAIEGLLTDLSGIDLADDAGPSPEETADAIEGLLADLSTVDVGDAEATAGGEAETVESTLSPEADSPDELEATGDGTHRVVGDSEVDQVVGVESNRTPAGAVADISATDLFCAFDGEGPVDVPDHVPTADGWTAAGYDDLAGGGRTASETFADLREAAPEVPSVLTAEPIATTDSAPESEPATESAPAGAAGPSIEIEVGADTGGGGLAASNGDSPSKQGDDADGEVDVPEIDVEPPADDADVPDIDLEPPEPGSTPGDGATTDADAVDEAAHEEIDVPEIDLEDPGVGDESAGEDVEAPPADGPPVDDESAEEDVETASARDDVEATPAEDDVEATPAEDDVEATPADARPDPEDADTAEEIVASAGDPARHDEPADELVGDVEGLFGDLSEVDLEPGEAATEERPTTDRAPDSEQAVSEVEEMFSDLSSVDVEPSGPEPVTAEPAAEPSTADAIPGGNPAEPEPETGPRIAGESDVDAVFEGFAEESVEEVIEADDEPAERPPARAEDDEPAEVETGDFMKQLARGKDPEEIGITLYDGSQTDVTGDAIAAGDTDDEDETAGPDVEGPSIESPSTGESSASTGDATDGPSIESPSTGGSSPAGTSEAADGESPSERVFAGVVDDASDGDDAAGEDVTTEDLFEEMTEDADGDAWSTVTDTEPVEEPTDATDSAGEDPSPDPGVEEPSPEARAGSTEGSAEAAADESREAAAGSGETSGSGVVEDARANAPGPSEPTTPGERVSKAQAGGRERTATDDSARFTASSEGPGSETLFPEADADADPGTESTIQGSSLDDENGDDEESVIGALKLLVERLGARIRNLF